jgi:hypothetical protein
VASALLWLALCVAGAAPQNDDCSGAIPLPNEVLYTMSTTDATTAGDPSPTCGSSPGKGVWFSFTPSIPGAVTISLCGSSFDTVLAVYTGTCEALALVPFGCVDDSPECGAQSSLTFLGAVGVTYRILAAGYAGASGDLSIRAEVAPVKIIQQPSGASVNAGETYTFSVLAMGSPTPAYQWRHKGSDIAGATSSWLVRPNLAPASQGAYTVVVTSGSASQTSSVANLTVLAALDVALDTPSLAWTTGGGTEGWYRQSDVSRDAADSAKCGGGSDSAPWMQTIATGAATMLFWWRLPTGADNTDYMSVTVNGQEQARLASLADGWFQQALYLGAGSQTCRWTYVKGAVPGPGLVYADQVSLLLGGTAAQLTGSPASRTVVAGSNVLFSVEAAGTPPMAYQWLYKNSPLVGATEKTLIVTNALPRDAGLYLAEVDNDYGAPVSSLPAELLVTTLPLDTAFDYRGLPLACDAPAWFGQIGTTQDGSDAARSGEITHNQASTMRFEAQGPATVGFWWKVSSETNYDALRFYVDSTPMAQIWGEMGWTYQSFAIPSGRHWVKWSYEKDNSLSRGQDAGWVDRIFYDGSPFISSSPGDSGTLALSWPGFLSGYVLQASGTLNSGWTNVPGTPVILGDEWFSINPSTAPKQFFRLVK